MKDQNKRNKRNFKKAPRGGETTPVALVSDKPVVGPGDAIQAQPLEVKVYGNNFDKALRAFRALVQKERILSSYKEKQSYEKPSDNAGERLTSLSESNWNFVAKVSADIRNTPKIANQELQKKLSRNPSPNNNLELKCLIPMEK